MSDESSTTDAAYGAAPARPAAPSVERAAAPGTDVGSSARVPAAEHARALGSIRDNGTQESALREIARRYGNRHAAAAAVGVRALSRRVVPEEELKKPPWTAVGPGAGLDLIPGAHDVPVSPVPGPVRHHATGATFPWSIVDKPDLDTVEMWLRYFDFGVAAKKEELSDPPGLCSFNGADMDYDVAVDRLMLEAPAGLGLDRAAVHTAAGNLLYALKHPGDSPYAKKPESSDPIALTIGVQANLTRHETLTTKEKSADPVTYQVTGQVAYQLHGEGKMGFELAVQGSVSFTLDRQGRTLSDLTTDGVRATLTNGQLAGQGAWVIPFFDGALQMQSFVQAVAGINWVQNAGTATTSVKMQRYSMVQAVAGMQVVYTLPGTDKHLQLFIQAQKSITGTDPKSTQDLQGAIGLQWAF